MSHVFYIKRGDRLPSVEATLRQPAPAGAVGDPINLSGVTEVRFLCSNGVNEPAIVVAPAAGQVRYDWGVAETVVAGSFDGEFEITWGDGRKQTVPNGQDEYLVVLITADLG